MRTMGSDCKLTIVGTGPELTNLKFKSENMAVKFVGKVPHYKMPEIYRKHDIFILFSEHEGCCNAALEAKACGLKLITNFDVKITSWIEIAKIYERIYLKTA